MVGVTDRAAPRGRARAAARMCSRSKMLLPLPLPLLVLLGTGAASSPGAPGALGPTLPFWTAPKPDGTRLQGYMKVAPNLTDTVIFRPDTEEEGRYNHAAMIMYHRGTITISWKNAPLEEDTPGQRVLYSQTRDGQSWSKAAELFPTLNTKETPSAQFAGPFAVLNGRLFASASPAVITLGDAQGSQFCQWPDGVDPRNCNCPGCNTKHRDQSGVEPAGLLMLREVKGSGELGPVFWGTPYGPPACYKEVGAKLGVKLLREMDAQTQADVRPLTHAHGKPAGKFAPPCDATSGTLKCEACPNGCQIYNLSSTKLGLANERAYYPLPGSAASGDVQLFRAHSGTLWASVRREVAVGQTGWSPVQETTIPNDDSNLNAGVLPERKGVFLLSNAAKARVRDPLTIALSRDGKDFSSCAIVQTCTALAAGRSTCRARQAKNHNVVRRPLRPSWRPF